MSLFKIRLVLSKFIEKRASWKIVRELKEKPGVSQKIFNKNNGLKNDAKQKSNAIPTLLIGFDQR